MVHHDNPQTRIDLPGAVTNSQQHLAPRVWYSSVNIMLL